MRFVTPRLLESDGEGCDSTTAPDRAMVLVEEGYSDVRRSKRVSPAYW